MEQSQALNVSLTEAMVRKKMNSDDIETIKKINFYFCNLSDVAVVEMMPNLEIASLSCNKIQSLKPFQHSTQLRELMIRNNNISSFMDLQYLSKLPKLKIVWLIGNPIANDPNYRNTVIKMLPQITKLDDTEITDLEKKAVIMDAKRPVMNSGPIKKLLSNPASFVDKSPILNDHPIKKPTPEKPKENLEKPSPTKDTKQSIQSMPDLPPIQQPQRVQSQLSSHKKLLPPKPQYDEDDTNLLQAVLALLPELSDESLDIVLYKIRELTK